MSKFTFTTKRKQKKRKRMAQVTSLSNAESIMKCDENNVRIIRAPARNKKVWASEE